MKKILLIAITLTMVLGASAQMKESEWNRLKHDPAYICGEGTGATKEEADQNALQDLISKVTVNVTSSSDYKLGQTQCNGELDERSQFTQSVKTFSSLTVNNAKQFENFKNPNWRIGRAVKEADVQEMFNNRARRVHDMVESAIKSEKKGRVDDALRNYYWALTLLKSLPNPNKETQMGSDGKDHVLSNWIKDRMNDIIDDIKVKCVAREGDDVELDITYKEKPVNSASFTYFDGRQWTSLVTANDGYASLEFVHNYNPKQYQIRIEFQYLKEAKSDKELEAVISAVGASEFRRAEKTIQGIKSQKNQAKVVVEQVQQNRPTFTSTHTKQIAPPAEVTDHVRYQEIMTAVEKAISMKSSIGIQQYFTTEGWDIYERLIDYGQARVMGTPSYKFIVNGNEVVARGQQLSFSFKNGTKKSFVEEVIYTFDANKMICNIAFGLGRTAEDDILNKKAWPDNVRMAIMDFLENYKTAYALKRTDYIESIFDEDAIIITGRIVKKAQMKDDLGKNSMNAAQVQYNRQTKKQYMENLRKCFASQEFVNINFSHNEVRKGRANTEVYGIQLEQDYHSSTYGDHGYLFLLVDLNDAKQPLIKVRTWQPEKDPNLQGGIYGINDFKF